MYRLLWLSKTPVHKYSTLSSSILGENIYNVTGKTCLLCKRLNKFESHIRSQSTVINPNMNPKKRKKRKNGKKYAELLVVSDGTSTQQKASVQKLTFKDLRLLANTSLNLSELYKLKEFSKNTKFIEEHTYNNLNVIENSPSVNSIEMDDLSTEKDNVLIYNIPSTIPPNAQAISQSFIDSEENAESTSDISNIGNESDLDLSSVKVNTFLPETIEEQISDIEMRDSSESDSKTPLDQKYRDEIASKTLAAYVEVCSSLKNPQRGLSAVNFHRGKAKRLLDKTFTPIKNVLVYNALLKSFAHKGDFNKIKEVLKIMEDEDVELNVKSYVAIFECLGRINVRNSHLKEIKFYTKEAFSKEITFDKMMNKGSFLNDEREVVLRAMKCYDSNYQPCYDEPLVMYKNHLVNHLNYKSQLKSRKLDYDDASRNFCPKKLREAVNKQIQLENDGYLIIKSIESREAPSKEVIRYRQLLEEHYKSWEDAALGAFNRDLATLTAHRSALSMEPYMRCIPPKYYVAVILDEAKKLAQGSETYSPTVNMLYRDMGYKVYMKYKVLQKQKTGVLNKIVKIHNKFCEQYVVCHPELDTVPNKEVYVNSRQHWQMMDHSLCSEGATLLMDHQPWVPTTLQFIGKFLYHIVMHDLKIDVNVMRANSTNKNYLPAFYTIFRTQGRIVKEEVKPHPILSKLYRFSMPDTLNFPTYELPMLCPPVPWISMHVGGYLISPCDVIRLPSQAIAQKQRMKEGRSQSLYPSLDALNQQSEVPWKVNQRILDIILQVFNSGGSARLDVPEPPTSLPLPPPINSEMDKSEKFKLFRQRLQYKRKKAEMYSLWCDCLYRLSLANHFRNDTFWLPHNMDFRGRVYPVPPHLNHLGSDLARSMLIFAESRPLGPKGLDWLKLHLINLTGLKKRSPVQERINFANKNLDLILDSANKPLTGKKWWAESDEPWQTLACCMEIADVLKCSDPEKFRSVFPIHQDGSCNGLQHYAALGRDSAGAFSVNLAPCNDPQDVYSAVVELVEKQRVSDAANGIEVAKVLKGFVKRKVIKQTVMTTVYGVTRYGARLQIARQLKDIDNFPKEYVWPASSYLTGRTFDSLRTMFTSTREIQDWFTECARLVSGVGSQHVEWVTPLGLPIVQPYFKYKKRSMSSVYESFSIDKYEKPNVLKQKNAFPPNFIHSLDSSHMMLTSVHCERAGITFVSVHDCYWTHPSTVHIMNKICREQFVALHSQPILENLSQFFFEKYSFDEGDIVCDGSVQELTKKKLNRVLRQLPKTGDFDIKQVLDSVYFFS